MPEHTVPGLVVTAALVALAILHYVMLLSLSGGVFVPSGHGLIFNSMALHLLEGRFDVDPAAVHDEVFLHEGRAYSYFSVLPALLRMPLVPFVDLATVQVEGPYRLAALVISAIGSAVFVRGMAAHVPGMAQWPFLILLVALLFSGPVVMIGPRPDVFNEVVLWGWALSIWFLAVLAPALDRSRAVSGGRLVALAAIGGCAVHARPTMGLGLLVALALFMIVLVWREPGNRSSVGGLLRAAFRWRMVMPAIVAIGFLAAAGGVNYGRWGNPFSFADMSMHAQMQMQFPDRQERLETYGLFNLRRIGFGLMYYFVPVWAFTRDGRFMFHDSIERMFDGFELPPSSFVLSDPLTLTLAVIGFAAVFRHRIPSVERGLVFAVLLGLAVPALLMLMAWFMAFRYRIEFMPLFTLCAALGALRVCQPQAGAAPSRRTILPIAMVTLLGLQIAMAHVFAVLYLLSPWGPSLWVAPQGLPAFYRSALGP